MEKTMLLINSEWNAEKSFRLIPISNDAPYVEAIFDPKAKVMAIIGKEKKETFHMVPKLNNFGDTELLRVGKRENGKNYAEERKTMETYSEYYIHHVDDVRSIVKILAVNEADFDYEVFLKSDEAVAVA